MLRVVTPKGVLREAVRVTPVCELRGKLNKRTFRAVEFADGMDARPTAVQIEFQQQMPMLEMNLFVFVGNLKPETVEGIMQELLSKGYFDFSSLEYQKAGLLENTIFDDGASKPYTSDYVQGQCFVNAPICNDIFGCGAFNKFYDSFGKEEEGGDDEE